MDEIKNIKLISKQTINMTEFNGHENPNVESEMPSPNNSFNNEVRGTEVETTNLRGHKQEQRKFQMIKNVFMISLGFLFNFSAYEALASIQSSLNSDKGLGTASLSVIYGALIVSCMFVPTALINLLGCKWTMVSSMLMYSVYIAANFYATWYTLIPGAILIGLGAAPLWSAKCTYLTETGHEYAGLVEEKAEVIVVRFFGIFFFLFQTSKIWGNLISSLVFAPKSDDIHLNRDVTICGPNYCNQELSGNTFLNNTWNTVELMSNKPDMQRVFMLCGIYSACSILGASLIAITVTSSKNPPSSSQRLTGFQLLLATFRHLKHPYQLLIIPLTFFSGLEQAFIGSHFTKAFVSCTLGIHNVGYVMICLGVVDAICSIAFGPTVKLFGRQPLYIVGAAINILLIIIMLHWKPEPENPVTLYIIAGFWGMADAIWQTQINALYGVLFKDVLEAAFANYRLWESIGFIAGYALHLSLCSHLQLYILITILCLGMLGYFAVEISIRWKLLQ